MRVPELQRQIIPQLRVAAADCTLSAPPLEERAQGEMLLYAERTVTLSLPVYLISQPP